MRLGTITIMAGLLRGCSRQDDPRLQGTWKSNREETVAAVFKSEPQWADATTERKERFSQLFGNLTVTYSNQVATTVSTLTTIGSTQVSPSTNSFRYKVVERGTNFVVIKTDDEFKTEDELSQIFTKGGVRRIEFVEDGAAYWAEMGFLMPGQKEKFDRVSP
jgi:hypothetical protein